MHSGSVGSYVNKAAPDFSPSRLIGAIAFWFIFLGAVSIAVSQLGIPALTTFVASIGAYLPNVIAAILIFVIAGVVAAAVGGLVARTMGDTPTGKVVGSVVPVLVMAIATFMILNQLQIATEIVTITYAALIGGVFLGDGARLRPRRPRGRRPDALRRLRQGPRAEGPGQGRHAPRQGARPAATPSTPRTRPQDGPRPSATAPRRGLARHWRVPRLDDRATAGGVVPGPSPRRLPDRRRRHGTTQRRTQGISLAKGPVPSSGWRCWPSASSR